MIVSLSDHNQQQIREIQQEKEELIKDYEEKRTGTSTMDIPISLAHIYTSKLYTFVVHFGCCSLMIEYSSPESLSELLASLSLYPHIHVYCRLFLYKTM